jgi:signal transduction histidine kinase
MSDHDNDWKEDARVFEILNRTGAAIASTLDLQDLVQTVTDAATQLTAAAFGAFFYNTTGEDGEVYQLYTLSGAPREAFENFGHPRATALFGPTFHGGGIIRIDDVRKDPRYGQWAPHHGMPKGHLPVSSYMAAPVISRGGEVIGGLFFGHPEPGMFTARAERTIVGVAAQAAIAIDNARLYEHVRRAAAERERLLAAERIARAEAERASVLKDEFLATLSHELRTPLNAILGWAEVLLDGEASEEERQQGLEVISRNARAQTRLIEDLLDMSRIISGKVRLDVQRIEMAGIVATAIESVRPWAVAKNITLTFEPDPRGAPVLGDPNRLQQVAWNLLSNAVKFTPDGGKVTVRIHSTPSVAELEVCDSGQGISNEFLPHVFERFRQADSSTTRRHGGLGLGLSIVKQLVELHGGSVEVSSSGSGLGASFVVRLPSAPARGEELGLPPSAAPAAAGADSPRLGGLQILVVDDEPDARQVLAKMLLHAGAAVRTAASAREALAAIAVARPDLLLSDIGMPGKDGYGLIRDLRALAPEEGGLIPAIAITAFARSEDRTRALISGYQIHLSKPVEPAELVATVASLTGRVRF